MGVVATFTRIEPMSVQLGATIVENAIDLTTGKCVWSNTFMKMAKSRQEQRKSPHGEWS